MATLNCGTINFGDDVFVNTRPQIRDLAARIRKAGSVPELECYEVGHVEEALAPARKGPSPRRCTSSSCSACPGGIGATEENVKFMRSLVPAEATWGVAAVGRHQQPMTELAMRLGGQARVGLEDNIYLSKGVLSEGSAPLVARAASYARSIGRTPVEPDRARTLLGDPPSERRVTVCTRTLVADGLTPVAAYATLRQADPERASFLFESVVAGDRWGRYSILGYRPRYDAILGAHGWTILGDANVSLDAAGDPLAAAEPLFRATDAGTPGGNPAAKLARASFGYLTWDLVHAIEKVPGWNGAIPATLARFLGGATIVVFDALAQTVTIAAERDEDVDRAHADLGDPRRAPQDRPPRSDAHPGRRDGRC